jgi:methylated-DNA-protein-cysteine methyltransferase-like protein
MSKILDENLLYQIFSVVEEIPKGKVATYGQIARLIGMDKNSRLIGRALSMSEFYGSYPCHRVINHKGRLVPGWIEQKELLLSEGVTFKNNDLVDLKKCKWNI